jgi:NTP pyrophosphatase (non-canonical NTP hydrolase)
MKKLPRALRESRGTAAGIAVQRGQVMIGTISDMHAMVWDLRSRISDKWATPERQDCLRYAFTEAGEAMDAYLRETRAGDSRNTFRQPNVYEELADCVMMLLTALGPEYDEDWEQTCPTDRDLVWTLDEVCGHVGGLLEYYSPFQTVYVVNMIKVCFGGVNMSEALTARLERIEAKHKER